MCITKMRVKVDVILFKQKVLSDGAYPIVVRFTQNRKRKYLRLGISVYPNHWDNVKNKLKHTCPNKEYIDNILTEALSKYQKQTLVLQSIGKPFTIDDLIESVNKSEKLTSVGCYLNVIIENLIKGNKVGNATHYQALYNSLNKFSRVENLKFMDINISFLNKFEAYLRGLGNKGNTISIKMRTLKATFNKAIKNGVVDKAYYPFEEYNVSQLKEVTSKRALKKEDILKILDFDTSLISNRPQSLAQFSKDIFLFSYLGCGINIMDIAYLKKDNINQGIVYYKRHKTSKVISFILQPKAIEIIDNYISSDRDYINKILIFVKFLRYRDKPV